MARRWLLAECERPSTRRGEEDENAKDAYERHEGRF